MPGQEPNGHPDPLHLRAEELLCTAPADMPTLPTEDVQALVHELNVHQMELEIQNEELRQAQLELAHSRDRLSDLYDFAPVGYVTLDRDGKILEANLTAATMLSVERRDLLRAKLCTFVHRDFQDEFYLHRRAVFSSEKQQTCELKMCKSDRPPVAVCLESTAIDGTPQQCRTALIDITARKRTEDDLQRLNRTLERRVDEQTQDVRLMAEVIDNVDEGVLITNDHLKSPGPHILFVNDAMCRITGYTRDELIGQSPRILQGPGTDPATLDRIREQLSAGHSCAAELINYRKDGTAYDTDLLITPLTDGGRKGTRFVSIHRDVTERKELQRQVLEIAAERDRWIGIELHDNVQQRLAGLGLLAKNLADSLEQKSLKEAHMATRLASGINESVSHVHELARGLMPVEVDVEGLRSALTILLSQISEQYHFNCDLQYHGVVDVADNFVATHLYYIAQEAVTNAQKHSRGDRVEVSLIASGGNITLTVRDNGIGIDEERNFGTRMGLRIMDHRAGLIGATLDVGPAATGGTQVTCSIFSRNGRIGDDSQHEIPRRTQGKAPDR